MKVEEKNTDRKAEVHIRVEGNVEELEEFGEYVDPVDKAICCYIPVEEGFRLKVNGKFSGTTQTLAYDVRIDGIYRKANSYVSKTVSYQKYKKLDFEQFLFNGDKGIIDTDMIVSQLSTSTTTPGEGPETLGAIELRVFVLRELGNECAIDDDRKYYAHDREVEDDEERDATYKSIAPDFVMTFEKNCAALEKAKANRERRKMDAKRPGKEPWAIFRFHYRSRQAIISKGLTINHDPNKKMKVGPHYLELDEVPQMLQGASSRKRKSGNASNHTSTPDISEPPVTDLKDRKNDAHIIPKPSFKTGQPKSTALTPSRKENAATLDRFPMPEQESTVEMALETYTNGTAKTTADDEAIAPEKSSSIAIEARTNGSTNINEPRKKVDGADVVYQPEDNMNQQAEDDLLQDVTLSKDNTAFTNGTEARITSMTEPIVKETTQSRVASVGNSDSAAGSTITTASTVEKEAVTPVKRPAEPTILRSPELKRARLTSPPTSRFPSPSSGTKTRELELLLAQARKSQHELRINRSEVATKQSAIDQKLEPFQQQMADELEQLKKSIEEEEAAYAEEEQNLKASEVLLAELENGNDGY